MGSDWADITNDPLNTGEKRERDSEKWRMPSTSADLENFAKQVVGPEDLHMLPQDMGLLPQEINNDLNEWTELAELDDSGDWTLADDPE